MNTQAPTATPGAPACHWNRDLEERVLPGRHADEYFLDPDHGPTDDCPGCRPCPEQHCTVCRRQHVDHAPVCPGCIVNARRRVDNVERLHHSLVGEARYGGSAGRPNASRPILGGEAMVLAAVGSDGDQARADATWNDVVSQRPDLALRSRDVSHAGDESRSDSLPTVQLLRQWESIWSEEQNRTVPANHLRPIRSTVAYLRDTTSWASRHIDSFPDYVRELAGHIVVLETVLHAGVRPDLGSAPCFDCSGVLKRMPREARPCEHARLVTTIAEYFDEPEFRLQHFFAYLERWNPKMLAEHKGCDQGGLGERYVCTNCDRRYDAPHYWLAVRAHISDQARPADQVAADRAATRRAKVRADIAAATAQPEPWQQADLDRLNGGRA